MRGVLYMGQSHKDCSKMSICGSRWRMCCKQTQLGVAMLISVFVDRGSRYVGTASESGQHVLTAHLFAGGRQLRGKIEYLDSC